MDSTSNLEQLPSGKFGATASKFRSENTFTEEVGISIYDKEPSLGGGERGMLRFY